MLQLSIKILKPILLTVLLIHSHISMKAQIFVSKGKIEFERKVNYHKILDEDANDWTENLKKNSAPFRIHYFDLYFNSNKSIYKPGREMEEASKEFFSDATASSNIVYKNLETESGVSQKQIFESLYLVQDSLKKFDWKLTNDVRKIAGFNCRKATTIICDSIFVFAFYTDEILTETGPENFHGLPGMILGIAIPRMHTTWFATKLELVEVGEKDFQIPVKGKKVNTKDLDLSMKKSLKDWGKWGHRNIWQASL